MVRGAVKMSLLVLFILCVSRVVTSSVTYGVKGVAIRLLMIYGAALYVSLAVVHVLFYVTACALVFCFLSLALSRVIANTAQCGMMGVAVR